MRERAKEDEAMPDRTHTTMLAPDAVAAAYAPHELTPRELTCELEHPHPGRAHTAEGWAWWKYSIWLVKDDDDLLIPALLSE